MIKNPLVAAATDETAESPTPRLIRSTTVLCVRRNDKVVMAGDGQVTLGESVINTGRRRFAASIRTKF